MVLWMLQTKFQVEKLLALNYYQVKKVKYKEGSKIHCRKRKSVYVTVDLWSNRQIRSYFGMTAHFIMDWSMQCVMLTCSRFRWCYSRGIWKSSGIILINTKAFVVITDSASNMIKSFLLSGFEEDAELLEDVTRWNSQLKIIRSVLRVPDEKLISLDTQTLVYDRKVMEDLVEILTPFETATHCVQGDSIVTSSVIVPCIQVLKSKVELLSYKYTTRFVVTQGLSQKKSAGGFFLKEMWTFLSQPTSPGAPKQLIIIYSVHIYIAHIHEGL